MKWLWKTWLVLKLIIIFEFGKWKWGEKCFLFFSLFFFFFLKTKKFSSSMLPLLDTAGCLGNARSYFVAATLYEYGFGVNVDHQKVWWLSKYVASRQLEFQKNFLINEIKNRNTSRRTSVISMSYCPLKFFSTNKLLHLIIPKTSIKPFNCQCLIYQSRVLAGAVVPAQAKS